MTPSAGGEAADFPSGRWTGFYQQLGGRFRQDMTLTFRGGVLTGTGSDGIGRFTLRGRYDAATREVWWTKSYLGAHDVHYRGFREGKGIWGTWEIRGGQRSGFHIWPLGEGMDAVESAATAATAPAPPARPRTVPSAPS